MATTTKKGSENSKAKPRRAVVKTSVPEQEQTIAELRRELEARNRDLAESLQRENVTAKELQDCKRQLVEALEQQTATSEILGVIASSPTDIQPVLNAVAETAARLCEAFDALIYLRDGDCLRLVGHHGPIPPPGPIGEFTRRLSRAMVSGRSVLDG